jgi:hypothetical protein
MKKYTKLMFVLAIIINSLTLAQTNNALNFVGNNTTPGWYCLVDVGNQSAHNFGNASFTIIVWFKSSTNDATLHRLVSKGFNGTTSGYFVTMGGDGKIYFGVNPECVVTTSSYNDGAWHMGAFVVDRTANTIKIFIDGLQSSITRFTGSGTIVGGNSLDITAISLNATTTDPLEFGCYWNGSYGTYPTEYFTGLLDEISFWSSAIDQYAVRYCLNYALTGSETNLVSYYNFNEGVAGGNNNSGTGNWAQYPYLVDSKSSLNGTLYNFALTGTTSNWVGGYALVVPGTSEATNVGQTSFTANWTAPTATYGTADSYLLEVATDVNFSSLVAGYNPLSVPSSSTSYNVAGLTGNTMYYYRVKAVSNSLGTGAGSYYKEVGTPQIISSSTTLSGGDYASLIIKGSGTIVTLNGDVNVNSNLHIGTGSTVNVGNYTLNLKGSVNLEGNFSSNTGQITSRFSSWIDSIQTAGKTHYFNNSQEIRLQLLTYGVDLSGEGRISSVPLSSFDPGSLFKTTVNHSTFNGEMIFNQNAILKTDASDTLIVTSNSTLTETSDGTGMLVGNVLMKNKTITAGSTVNVFGMDITAPADLDLTFGKIARSNSIPVTNVLAKKSGIAAAISRTYKFTNLNTSGRNITIQFPWKSKEDNGCDLTRLQVWRLNGSTWTLLQNASGQTTFNASATRSITVLTNDGGTFYISDVNNPLPVRLISLSANANGSSVTLNWQTATEVNNYGFEVERALTALGMTWIKLGFVQGHGNSNSPKSYSFEDTNPPVGKVQYRLKQIDFDGKYEYSDVIEAKIETPANFKLAQNFPNPFNPTTVINYQIPAASHVTLKVYDVLGKEVATLVDELKPAGIYNSTFNTLRSSFASGVYFYTLQAGDFRDTKKFMLMK